MTPGEIPAEHKQILRELTGRPHSDEGEVMACLAKILTVDRAMVRAEIAAQIKARRCGFDACDRCSCRAEDAAIAQGQAIGGSLEDRS